VSNIKTYRIAVIPGDGIGQEVVPEAIKILNLAAELSGDFTFEWDFFPWGCDYYLQHGSMMPEDGIDSLRSYDQIFLGAVGMPDLVPDHVSLWGLLLKIRREFKQTVNLRPIKSLKGLNTPLASKEEFDFIIVRENSEGEYSDSGGRIHSGDDEIAIQNSVFTKRNTKKVMNFAKELSLERSGVITSVTKSNGLSHSMPFWDEVFKEITGSSKLTSSSVHVDAMAAFLVLKPQEFDVIVASNLFGDILSDLGSAIMGSIGIAASGNINVERKYPSMFEPVHGSAPDIVGKNSANPIGQIWSGALMLEFLGHSDSAKLIMDAIENSLQEGVKTPDLKGRYATNEVTNQLMKFMKAQTV